MRYGEEHAMKVVDAELIEKHQQLIEKYQQEIDDLEEKKDKNLKVMLLLKGVNRRLQDIVVNKNEFRHLNFFNLPFVIYKKDGNKLIEVYKDNYVSDENEIELNGKRNFYGKLLNSSRAKCLINQDKFGIKVDVDKDNYLLIFFPTEDFDAKLIEEYNPFSMKDLSLISSKIISSIKDN